MTQLYTAFQGIALTAFVVSSNVAFSWQCHRSLPIFSLCKQYQLSIKNTNFHPTTVSFEVGCIFFKKIKLLWNIKGIYLTEGFSDRLFFCIPDDRKILAYKVSIINVLIYLILVNDFSFTVSVYLTFHIMAIWIKFSTLNILHK